MNTEMFYAFIAGMLVLAATPGPGVMGAVSKAISEGFRASLFFIGGLVLGDIIFFLLAVAGMSAISEKMGNMFYIIRIAGGLYLFYLGIKMFKSGSIQLSKPDVYKNSWVKTFYGGFVLTLGNPKPILFYASILPAIVDIKHIQAVDAAAMITAIVCISFLVLGFYSFFAALSGKYITKSKSQTRAGRAGGVLMCITGTYIALK